MIHGENHKSHRIGWLRAAVLGANDGIISTSSLIIGIAAANIDQNHIIITGIAGLVAGAMSMAAGEYVSVSSQAETERADLTIEAKALKEHPELELEELTQIYINRGLTRDLSYQVAKQLTAHNPLEAHARDELGINSTYQAQPIQAALFSAITFSIGSFLPITITYFTPHQYLVNSITASTIIFLGMLGALAAQAGGASLIKGALRVILFGALAMLTTALIGSFFGVNV